MKVLDRIFGKVAAALVAKGTGELGRMFARAEGETAAVDLSVKDPYAASTWVRAAVNQIVRPITQVPVRVAELDGTVLEDAGLEQWLARPVAGMSGAEMIEAAVGWLVLEGEVAMILGDDWLVPFRDATRLGRPILISGKRLEPVVEGDDLLGWRYRVKGKDVPLLPAQVIMARQWNPRNPLRGLGDLEAAQVAVESEAAAGRYVRAQMAEMGENADYVVSKDASLTEAQQEQITAALRQRARMRKRGEFRPLFFTGDIDVKSSAKMVPDANFVAVRGATQKEIFVALGVPPSFAEPTASYSIGSASDRYRLIEDRCMPLGQKVVDMLADMASRILGREVQAYLEWDEHSTMQQVRRERVDAAQKLWGMGVPLKEVNEALQLGLQEVPGWEIGYLPFGLVPVGELPGTVPSVDPALAEPEDEKGALRKAIAAAEGKIVEKGGDVETLDWQTKRPAQEVAQWSLVIAGQRASKRAVAQVVRKAVFELRSQVLERLDAKALKDGERPMVEDVVIPLEPWKTELVGELKREARRALVLAGEQVWSELKRDDPFRMPEASVTGYLNLRENRLAGIADQIHGLVMGQISEGVDAGETRAQLAERIRQVTAGIGKERAETIAQTETAVAYGQGRQLGMESAGIKKKKWLTSGNANVRASHRAANGQVVGVTEKFTVGGEELNHPGDPVGSAGNVINCHCVAVAVE